MGKSFCMPITHSENNSYTLNFQRGDEVISKLKEFLNSKNIKAGHISGLGAASRLVIAYYNLNTREYEKKEFAEEVEILSLNGNVGVKDGEIIVHMHGVFGRRDFTTFGGHIFEIVISGAGEIHLNAFSGEINRKYDDSTGLNLMCSIG
jgi:predicted DNA-binding protein with PD1-like motif